MTEEKYDDGEKGKKDDEEYQAGHLSADTEEDASDGASEQYKRKVNSFSGEISF
ncbi:hypothetical protein HK097_010436, partial [Rhizophlyctis rosea]